MGFWFVAQWVVNLLMDGWHGSVPVYLSMVHFLLVLLGCSSTAFMASSSARMMVFVGNCRMAACNTGNLNMLNCMLQGLNHLLYVHSPG